MVLAPPVRPAPLESSRRLPGQLFAVIVKPAHFLPQKLPQNAVSVQPTPTQPREVLRARVLLGTRQVQEEEGFSTPATAWHVRQASTRHQMVMKYALIVLLEPTLHLWQLSPATNVRPIPTPQWVASCVSATRVSQDLADLALLAQRGHSRQILDQMPAPSARRANSRRYQQLYSVPGAPIMLILLREAPRANATLDIPGQAMSVVGVVRGPSRLLLDQAAAMSAQQTLIPNQLVRLSVTHVLSTRVPCLGALLASVKRDTLANRLHAQHALEEPTRQRQAHKAALHAPLVC